MSSRNGAHRVDHQPGLVSVALMIAAPALYAPMRVWALNRSAIAHPERLITLAVLFWAMGLGAAIALARAGLSRRRSSQFAFVGLSLFVFGGAFVEALGSARGVALLLGLLALSIAIIVRLDSLGAVDLLITWVALFLALSPPASAVAATLSSAGGEVVALEPIQLELETHPDIYLVVLDGYAGELAMERVLLFDNSEVLEHLEARGYEVPVAWSSYTFTHLSIPSILDMSLPLTAGAVASNTDADLRQMMGGRNRLVETLRAEGYWYTMVEAGWGGSKCGEQVDECVSGPFYDDAVAAVLDTTALSPLIRRVYGHPFTQGSLHSMEWLTDHVTRLSGNGRPDLVFGHILAPHHPYLLDAKCGVGPTDWGGAEDGERADSSKYLDQVRCVNRFIEELTSILPSDVILVLSADHGSELRHQLSRPPAEWTPLDQLERMNVFVALRVPGGCELKKPVMLPEVMARVLSCLGPTPVPVPERRMFYVSGTIREVPAEEVRLLLDLD